MDLSYPFTGRWLVQNSPADRVPSHGATRFATDHAIEFVPVGIDGRTAAFGLRSAFRPEPAERFSGFGRDVLAPFDGEVIAIHDGEPDHAARPGETVRRGERLAACGNSGNSTEPHVHVQAIDDPDAGRARPVPITFDGALPRNGEVVDAGP